MAWYSGIGKSTKVTTLRALYKKKGVKGLKRKHHGKKHLRSVKMRVYRKVGHKLKATGRKARVRRYVRY